MVLLKSRMVRRMPVSIVCGRLHKSRLSVLHCQCMVSIVSRRVVAVTQRINGGVVVHGVFGVYQGKGFELNSRKHNWQNLRMIKKHR